MASQFDIVIVGASFGGVAAALAAARYGKSVALVDAGGNVGGQATAQGLTRWDESAPVTSPNTYGSSKSYQVLKDDIRGWYRAYTKLAPGARTSDFNPGFATSGHPFSADCNVTETVLRQLLEDAASHVTLMLDAPVLSADAGNGTIRSLALAKRRNRRGDDLSRRDRSRRPPAPLRRFVGRRRRGEERYRGTARGGRRRIPAISSR